MNSDEIDELISSLSRSHLIDSSEDEISETETNMATATESNVHRGNTPNLHLLKLYVDTIPYYNGDTNTLEIFISACEYLFATYNVFNDVELKNFLLRVVIGKLVDRAQILIGTRSELNSWELIKEALRQSFGDQRNLECLEQDLIVLCPMKNEHPLEFGKRIQIARSKLASKISSQSETTMPKETKLIYLKQYDQVALKTFIRGLSGHLQSIVRLRNPASLEIAMHFVTEEENFRYTQNLPQLLTKPNNTMRQQTNIIRNQDQFVYKPRPMSQMNRPTPNFNSNYTSFNHNNNFQRPNTFQYNSQPRFPSRPINIQPRPVKHHFPTNAQVFGPPRDVFKPTGQRPTNIPEPMSTTSRNPTIRQSIRNRFQPSGPKNFVSEELHFHENKNAEVPYNSHAQYAPIEETFNDLEQTEEAVDDFLFDEDTIELNLQDYEYNAPNTNENVNFPTAGPPTNLT